MVKITDITGNTISRSKNIFLPSIKRTTVDVRPNKEHFALKL